MLVQKTVAVPDEVTATVVKVQGKAYLERAARKKVRLEDGRILLEKDRITTREGGHVVLVLRDGSMFALVPNSQLTLQKLSDKGAAGTVLRLASGVVQVLVNKLEKSMTFVVEAGGTVVGVKGTEFQVSALSAETLLEVLNGEVEMRGLEDEEPYLVGPGYRGSEKGGEVREVRRMTPQEIARIRAAWLIKSDAARQGYFDRVRKMKEKK